MNHSRLLGGQFRPPDAQVSLSSALSPLLRCQPLATPSCRASLASSCPSSPATPRHSPLTPRGLTRSFTQARDPNWARRRGVARATTSRPSGGERRCITGRRRRSGRGGTRGSALRRGLVVSWRSPDLERRASEEEIASRESAFASWAFARSPCGGERTARLLSRLSRLKRRVCSRSLQEPLGPIEFAQGDAGLACPGGAVARRGPGWGVRETERCECGTKTTTTALPSLPLAL